MLFGESMYNNLTIADTSITNEHTMLVFLCSKKIAAERL